MPPPTTPTALTATPLDISKADQRDLTAIKAEAAKQSLVLGLAKAKTEYGQELVGAIHENANEEFRDAVRGILAVKNDPNNTDEEQAYLEEFGLHMLSRAATHLSEVTESGAGAINAEVGRDLRVAAPPPRRVGLLGRLLGETAEDE